MRHWYIAIGLAAGLLLAPAADAQKKSQPAQNIEFSRISCAEFIRDLSTASEEDAGAILLWLDGYLSGLSGDTTLRWDGLEAFATNLTEYCARNGKQKLLDAARKVGIQ